MIRAIETRYKGYRFRSRLEARWAVFFEHIGVEWTYEPEGFERDDWNGGTLRYLPDFRISGRSPTGRDVSYWVEVKGDKNWLFENKDELDFLHDFGGVLPDFCDCGDDPSLSGGLILLGDIPDIQSGIMFLPVLYHDQGVHRAWRCISTNGQGGILLEHLDQVYRFAHGSDDVSYNLAAFSQEECDFQPKVVDTKYYSPGIVLSLRAARSARFEHGEVPA